MSSETVSTEGVSQATDEATVRCLILPMSGFDILLPNTAVAEITAYEQPRALTNVPEWILGTLYWRGRSLPLLSYERMLLRQEVLPQKNSRVVVLNTLSGNPELPFMGIVTQGLPHLVIVRASQLEYGEPVTTDEHGLLARLLLDGKELYLPNLDSIEEMLTQLIPKGL